MIGRVFGGRFEVVQVIGQGGMGTVFEARHATLPRKFAIKVLRPELASNPRFVERFRREAIAAARIEHPNVVYITDFGHTEDNLVYLVMEYLEGVGLDNVLGANFRISLNRTLPIIAQLADALDLAHQHGVVHRDLKPENILLSEVRGRKDVVKILDFGIAKLKLEQPVGDALTVRGQVFGTAEYMSPEQATGEECDGRSDIYAIGCLAYEMITGNPPFLGPAVRVLNAHVREAAVAPSKRLKDHPIPAMVDAIVLRCLAKSPNERYQTAGELRRDLIKARGVLYGMGAEIAQRDKRHSDTFAAVSRNALTSGWQALGGKVPELLSEHSGLLPVMVGQAGTGQLDAPSATSGLTPQNTEVMRDDYHDALRDLALALVQAAVAPPEMSDSLDRLLAIEEEAAALTGAIALSEQNFDRIRFDYGQREKQLRYAILDLSMSRAQLVGRAEADQSQASASAVGDLDFQIAALTHSCAEVSGECQEKIRELDGEVKKCRDAKREREQEAAELYQGLHTRIEALRPAARTPELYNLYGELDRRVGALHPPPR